MNEFIIKASEVKVGDFIKANDGSWLVVKKVVSWAQWGVWIYVNELSENKKSALVNNDVLLKVKR